MYSVAWKSHDSRRFFILTFLQGYTFLEQLLVMNHELWIFGSRSNGMKVELMRLRHFVSVVA
jgi:hypothetical protein